MLAEKVVRSFIAFLVGIYIARYLGPGQYGLLSYAISFAGLFSSFANLGMDQIVVRELVKYPEKRDVILGTVFRLRIIGSFVAIFLVTITAYLIREPSYNLLLIVIISSATIFQSLGVVELFFQSRVEAKKNVYAQSSSFFITSLLKILLIIFEQPLVYFAIVHLTEFILLSAGYYIIYRANKLSLSDWKYNGKTAISLFKDSWPLVLSGVVIIIYMKIDQVMIKNLMTVTDVGYYAVAVKLCEAWYFVSITISTSLFPAIVNAKAINESLYLSRLQKLYDILALIAIAIALPVTLFSDFIIQILFGSQYQPAASVLSIYIWAALATFLGVASSQYLISENLTKLAFWRTLLGMIVNVIMNLILIPVYGINGAAISTLVSFSVSVFAIYFDKKSRLQFFMMMRAVLLLNVLKLFSNYFKKNFNK